MAIIEVGFKPTSFTNNLAPPYTSTSTSKLIDLSALGSSIPSRVQIVAGMRIKKYWVYCRAATGGISGSVNVGAYATDQTTNAAGNLVDSGAQVTTSVATGAWYGVDVDIDLSSLASQWIKPAVGNTANMRHNYVQGVSGDAEVRTSQNFPNPFTGLPNNLVFGIYMEIETGGSAITPTSDAIYGQPGTFTSAGFSTAPNIGTLGGVAISGVSATGYTAPTLVDETVVPMPGVRQLSVSNGTQSAVANVTLGAPDGMVAVFLSGTLNTSNTGILHNFVPAAKAGDVIIAPIGAGVDAQGNISTLLTYFEAWHLSVDAGDDDIGTARSYTVTIDDEGNVKITRSGITGIGITRRGITSSPLTTSD